MPLPMDAPVHDLIRPDFLGKVGRVLRLLFPTEEERLLIRAMRALGAFDQGHYLQSYGLHWLYRALALHHYAVLGEALGLKPTPTFCPKAYLAQNLDVAQAGVSPYLHWLMSGRHEGRLTTAPKAKPPTPQTYQPFSPVPFTPRQRFAVVVHVYYPEVWPELSRALARLTHRFDLFVTVVDRPDMPTDLEPRIRADWPHAQIHRIQNKGRDILPFLTLINAGVLDGYDAVLKLHSKKSAHRFDGPAWRRKLVGGVLPPDTSECLTRFLADPGAALWVADGQTYSDPRWWGLNQQRVQSLMARLELGVQDLMFPAGSIYWIKPSLLRALGALDLHHSEFEPEAGQLDGTLAHAVERAVGLLCQAAGQTVVETAQLRRTATAVRPTGPSYVSAFYLPQFHPIPENDAWWGQGFTEWRGVTAAKPLFHGHDQPHLPADLGFYDLRQTEVMGQQAALAQSAGIDAFCVYFYWFEGRRLLQQPMDRLLAQPEVPFPFYLCWANESWRRNWDGQSGEVLVPQSYPDGFEDQLAADLLPYLRDQRYQRPDGQRPRFVIYKPQDLPDPAASVARLRAAWHQAGIGEVEIGAVLVAPLAEPDVAAFDFFVEMPPHGFVEAEDVCTPDLPGLRPDFSGLGYRYDRLIKRSCDPAYLARLPDRTIRGVMPSWDNTARRGPAAHFAYGASPVSFQRWLSELQTLGWDRSYRGELFVNAWNEWGEKAVLEPGLRYGHAYLDTLREVTGKPWRG